MASQCENCHQDYGQLAFCPHCGLGQVCTACDRPFDPGAKFCGKCGATRQAARLSEDDEGKEPSHASEEKTIKEPVKEQAPGDLVQGGQTRPTAPPPIEKMNRKKLPPALIGTVIAILVFVAIVSSGILTSPEKQIEKTVNQFLDAVVNADYQKIIDLYDPTSPYIEDIEYLSEIRGKVKIEVKAFYGHEIEDDYAEVIARLKVDSLEFNESITEDLHVELFKLNNKWYIYDAY